MLVIPRHHFSYCLLLLLFIPAGQADWWEDLVNGAHKKLVQAADWLRDKAAPTVREKFDSAKETVQDPKTHEKIQEWVQEEVVPTIKQKFEQFKEFINGDVMPEVQKVIEAGVEASKRREEKENREKVSEEE